MVGDRTATCYALLINAELTPGNSLMSRTYRNGGDLISTLLTDKQTRHACAALTLKKLCRIDKLTRHFNGLSRALHRVNKTICLVITKVKFNWPLALVKYKTFTKQHRAPCWDS
jgi:hypothetical protein